MKKDFLRILLTLRPYFLFYSLLRLKGVHARAGKGTGLSRGSKDLQGQSMSVHASREASLPL